MVVQVFGLSIVKEILNKNNGIDDYITNGKNTIAVRMATSEVLGELIKKVGSPLFMTSANRSGEPECKKIDEIEKTMIDNVNLFYAEQTEFIF